MRARYGRLAGWAAAFVMAAALPAPAADQLVLLDEVFIKGPKVYLGDVAKIEGDNAERLARIEIGPAPLPGESKPLLASLVAARLRGAGIDPAEVHIKGAGRTVTRAMSLEVQARDVADSLRNFILAEMPWDAASAEVDVAEPLASIVIPEGAYEIQWRPGPQYGYLGDGIFRGTLLVDGRPEKQFTLKANVNAYGEVIVAANDIPRGRIISPVDLAVRKQSLHTVPNDVLTDPAGIVGNVARKTIFAGQHLSARNVEPPVVVKRNQIINVRLRTGTVKVDTRAQALMDGRAGDVILCANPASKQQFQGVVRADGVVVVE